MNNCKNIAKILQRMVSDGYVFGEASIINVDPTLYVITHPNRKYEKKCEEKRLIRLGLSITSAI